jgi:hypothetical protein
MSFTLFFKEEAQSDIQGSYIWYEEKLKGLGDRFIYAFEECFDDIRNNLFMNQEGKLGVRYGFVHTFPYVVVYEIEEKNIIIYAVFNTHRNPSVLKRRRK